MVLNHETVIWDMYNYSWYLRYVRFTNEFLVWLLFIDVTKLSELGNARLEVPGVSSELQRG